MDREITQLKQENGYDFTAYVMPEASKKKICLQLKACLVIIMSCFIIAVQVLSFLANF